MSNIAPYNEREREREREKGGVDDNFVFVNNYCVF